jgi:hypothetical protein
MVVFSQFPVILDECSAIGVMGWIIYIDEEEFSSQKPEFRIKFCATGG